MHRLSTKQLTFTALLAAVYALLTVTLPIPQFSGVQIRFAEALTVLPFLFPAAAPGLVVGCFIANLFSPFALDIVFGAFATLLACLLTPRSNIAETMKRMKKYSYTLLACLLTARMPNRWLAPLPPVLCNALIVGFEIAWSTVGFTPGFWPAFALNMFTVGLGELCACYLLGLPLLSALLRLPQVRALVPAQRLEKLA